MGIIIFLMLLTIALISFVVGFTFYFKLLFYLRKNKPKLLDKLSVKKEEWVVEGDKSLHNSVFKFGFKYIYPHLPFFGKMETVRFFPYLFTRDKDDDKETMIYKRTYLVCMILFLVFVILFMFSSSFMD